MRRRFLKQCACLSLMGSGAAAMNGKLSLIQSALANTGGYGGLSDYKSLVCVFLYGGSDSFNLFIPTAAADYDAYAASRGNLAVPRDAMLTGNTDTGIGFNPLLPNLHALYDRGDAAVIANVGNLIQPVTRQDYLASTNDSNGAIPNDLFAHNHQQEQWLKGFSSEAAGVIPSGWGGRMADLLASANPGATLPPSFSLAGSNFWLPGNNVQPLNINASNGLSLLTYLDDGVGGSSNLDRASTLDRILAYEQPHALKAQAAAALARAKRGSAQLDAALDVFPADGFATGHDADSRLAQQLRMVARLIASREALGMHRQIFFVAAGGWDTHDNQTPRLNLLLPDLDRSLGDFQATLDELGASQSVTTFTASDFGRTLTINGDGSDHGWGGHYLTIGGAVNGGAVYGTLPNFEIGGSDDSGDKGRLIPSVSINQYGAMLAQWMGVSDTDVHEIFPDLHHFGSDWSNQIALLG